MVQYNLEKIKNSVIEGDCLKVLPKIPDGSIDLVLTDPPYMISSSVKIRRQRNPLKFDSKSKMAAGLRARQWIRKNEGRTEWKFKGKDIEYEFGSWDIFETMTDYLKFTEEWFKECIRVLRKGGHVITFCDKHKITYLVHWAEKLGVKTRQPLFWVKSNPVPQARKVAFMSAIEMCYWGTKETTGREFATFNYELGQHPDYVKEPICSGNERRQFGFHPTQKPLKVIEWILSYLSKKDDIVLDPFLGSGTTAIACKRLKRNFIGIEKEPKYVKMSRERIKGQSEPLL